MSDSMYVLMADKPTPEWTPMVHKLLSDGTYLPDDYPWWPVMVASDRKTCRRFINEHPGLGYRIVAIPESLIEDPDADPIRYLVSHAQAQDA